MKLLTELVIEVESILSENHNCVVELNDLSRKDTDYLMKALVKYDVRRAVVISKEKNSVSYALHINTPTKKNA